jgi:ribosomal protein S18 acetylase RimI-like enzyme
MRSSIEIVELDAEAVLGRQRGEIEDLWRLVFPQVHPDVRRGGIDGRLHDALLEGLKSPTAVLSTQRDNGAAIALYEARGWQIILDEIAFGDEGPPYVVMGRDLPCA